MPKHPHYEVMMEWAADTSKVVQYLDQGGQWEDCEMPPMWNFGAKYRFKPEKKPDVVHSIHVELSSLGTHCGVALTNGTCSRNLSLTFDGETGKLIKAEVLHAE